MFRLFEYYLKIECAMSPNTVASYISDLTAFFSAVGKDPKDVVPEDIISYFAETTTLSKRSQARVLSSLHSFYKWMIMEGEMTDNPSDAIEAPKLGKYLPAVLSVEEVERLIAAVDLDSAFGKRDRAMLETLYGLGLRVSELISLRISSIWTEQGFVSVIGKGDKQRLVPLGGMARDAIRRECLGVRKNFVSGTHGHSSGVPSLAYGQPINAVKFIIPCRKRAYRRHGGKGVAHIGLAQCAQPAHTLQTVKRGERRSPVRLRKDGKVR